MTDAGLLAADHAARADALDTGRSFIVQAPAGSGKTELLIQRYLALLATVSEPEEVLAITFTRKAAAEMQVRILGALDAAGRGEAGSTGHERLTLSLAAAALRHGERLGWDFADNPRRLRIHTLDQVNAMVSRMRPLTAATTTAGLGVVEGDDSRYLYRRAAVATLDWLPEKGGPGTAVAAVLRHLDGKVQTYADYVGRMLQNRDQWLPIVVPGRSDPEAWRPRFESALADVSRRHLDLLRDSVPPAAVPELLEIAAIAGRQVADEAGDPRIAGLAGIAALPAADDPDSWTGLAHLLLTEKGTWRKSVDYRLGFPPIAKENKRRFADLVAALADVPALAERLHDVRILPGIQYSDSQWDVLLALFELLPVAVHELHRVFRQHGATDFVEVALAAADALGSADAPGDVAMLLDYRIRHVLVDEMQDTSHAQYRMLEALTGGWETGDGRTLFCVGDPMQSIYRFRNAEVARFLAARRDGIGHVRLEPLLLRRNFRSRAGLVDWFNRNFPAILAPADDPALGAVSYSAAVAAAGDGPDGRDDGPVRVWPVYGADSVAEAETGLRAIEALLRDHPGDSIAILVRSRTHLRTLLPRMRRAGIACTAIEIDRLTDLPEIIELLALTRVAIHDADRVAWLGLLRAPWAGLGWTDLVKLCRGDRDSTVAELLADPERRDGLSAHAGQALERVLPAIDELRAAAPTLTLRDRVERAWLRLGGPAIAGDAAALDNAYAFLDVLGELEDGGGLRDLADLERRLDDKRSASRAAGAVTVMTIHKAKGLQFDHVLLYGLGRQPRSDEATVLRWYDPAGQNDPLARIVAPIGSRQEVEKDPVYRYVSEMGKRRERHEWSRLLYVACTRARKSLHLVGHAKPGSKPGEVVPESRSLLALLWPAVATTFASGADAGPPVAGAGGIGDDGWASPPLRRFTDRWQLPAVAAMPGPETEAAAIPDPVEFYWVGSEARIAGTLVHRYLQLIAEGALALDAEQDRQHALMRRWLLEAGIGESRQAPIADRVARALDGLATDERARWILSGDGESELALSGQIDGRLVTGIIDRVRVDGNVHWIVDFKTGSHEGGGLDDFLVAEADRYRAQLRLYRDLYSGLDEVPDDADLRCALYYPLLGRFLEVDVDRDTPRQ